MAPLPSELRKSLDKAVVAARDEAESACEAALSALGVPADQAPPGISDEQRGLRNALRAKQRQLGGAFEQLTSECAYEQWHLMLFARFLAENDLLIHPSGAPVNLSEVAELAREEGESDSWLLAARYAAAMLPGIFKTADPCVRLPLAAEGRKALEDILEALPPEVFVADDALGWVYQFWQTKRKKEVNASERKIGGADLAPVTQLFTEHYMVRFLLENSLGAWWAARHPGSPLLAEWEFLRFDDDGGPAAGRFDDWPETAAEVTVMDLCCGSGHFLVAAFEMLRKMREEEEGLSTCEAARAALCDNLCGLELDPRCIQLAAFALALAAWKLSGYHELPPLNLACTGIPTRASLEDWTKLAKGDERLEHALARLHELFKDADTLGSLIDPRRAVEDGTLESVPFEEVAPLLERALAGDADPVAAVFGDGAREVAKAATLLAGSNTLVATNVPYLGRGKQADVLRAHLEAHYSSAKHDIATAFLQRIREAGDGRSVVAVVVPEAWLVQATYRKFTRRFLTESDLRFAAFLGEEAFESFGIRGPRAMLALIGNPSSASQRGTYVLDVSTPPGRDPVLIPEKIRNLKGGRGALLSRDNPRLGGAGETAMLAQIATSTEGMSTGDNPKYERAFWEIDRFGEEWELLQASPDDNAAFDGREAVVRWRRGEGELAADPGARIQGLGLYESAGVLVGRMRRIRATLFQGGLFDKGCVVLQPKDPANLSAVYAYAIGGPYEADVRHIAGTTSVSAATLLKVPFDLDHWTKVAAERYPDGLPEPHSEDPTQWLFKGKVLGSEQPLQVALARLLGYCWPHQSPDELDVLADADGIVCLPAVAGEPPAHERLRKLLEAAYGDDFSQQTIDELLAPEGSATLEEWLRDRAFANHAKLFHNRPFIWHIWDGRKDGFSALVNYHKFDHQTLEKLGFTHLNWWIERQKTDAGNSVPGAEVRLAAAQELQRKLKLILEGEAPSDIYVRWKSLAEQPLGWEPDLNDGVRVNIRPLVAAVVLRAKLAIHWKQDRGKDSEPNASGTLDRLNDLHLRSLRSGWRGGRLCAVGDSAILDAVVAAVQTAAEYDKNDQVAPAVVLWTDKAREWEPVLPSLRGRLHLLTLGSYARDSLQGPAIWLRCAVAGAIDGLDFSDGRTPVVYLPGIGREDLRSVADLDPSLQPLVELQYRGVFWTHPNGRDWTVVGFLRNKEKGLGFAVKENAETLAAIRRALAVLLLERVPDLSDRELDATDFDALLQPDSTRSLLQWLDDPAGFGQAQTDEQWAAFLSTCKKEWGVDPETDGELFVAEQLGGRKGAWARVWERFAEAPEKYPGVPEHLRAAKPQVLMPEHPDSWPQVNEDAETDVRDALGGLGHAQPDEARAKLRELERVHGERRGWLWGCMGRAPVAYALEHLVALADLTEEGWKVGAVADIAGQYAGSGWRVDDAVLKALAIVDRVEDVEAVRTAADVLYRVWLEQGAKALQMAAGAEDWPAGFDSAAVPPGTCVLFSDGLRYDLGKRLSVLLGDLGCECEIAADMSALPPITSTAKPAVSPVARGLGTGPDFDPVPLGGSSKLTAELLRKLIREAGWQVLEPAEGGDPSGRAWTELGDIDEFGHSHGWKLARAVDAELREIAQRVEWLLKYGWQRIVVVTDHGWLLVPGGLVKVELPEHLAEKRKGRCTRVKGTSSVDYQTLPWRFNPAVRVAFAPGISTFVAGQEYDHGGLSPQECVVPRLTVTREGGPASAAVEIESVTWVGMRCRVQAKDAPAGLRLDLRTKAGDAGSTLLASPQTFGGSTASALVENDEQTGSAALVVLIDEAGAVIKQAPTVVGGDA